MTHRTWGLALAACFLLCRPAFARSADVRLPVFVDGKNVDRRSPSALARNGTTFIEAVRATRIFDGLLSFGERGRIVRLTIDRRTMTFTVGSKLAKLDGATIALPVAPFTSEGDTYLPLLTVAKLGSARVVVDDRRHIVSFKLGGGDGFARPVSASHQSDEDVEPSPAQALAVTTTGTIDATGLHARGALRNTTISTYKLSFPSAKQIAFVLSRNGSEVWDSSKTVTGNKPSSLSIGALDTQMVSADLPDFDKLGPGRYLLRVRLMTLIPLDLAPISLGDFTPSPAASR